MSADAPAEDPKLADLSPEERAALDRRGFVKRGRELVWREPDGSLRREPFSRVYYLHTTHGIFRTSKLSGEVVEV